MVVYEESPERHENLQKLVYIKKMDGQIGYILTLAEKKYGGNLDMVIKVHKALTSRRRNRMKNIGNGVRKR